ncbi:MAG TPA: PaaI family thioesterase [Beijerinckiaceae bacterium]|nr:PaaI family thioesterase [Beijerinckiaceae bacterium]
MGLIDGVTFGVFDRQQVADMTGREMLEAMMAGKLPAPTIGRALNFILTEVGDGTAVFEGETNSGIMNPIGTVHGGWVLTMIDSATACAAQSTLPAGVSQTTVETKANMTRPIFVDTGRVRCEGRVISRGNQIITTEATVTDSAGRILAHGTSTVMVLRPR